MSAEPRNIELPAHSRDLLTSLVVQTDVNQQFGQQKPKKMHEELFAENVCGPNYSKKLLFINLCFFRARLHDRFALESIS